MSVLKQGDAYSIPVCISANGEALDIADVETAEFYLGKTRKLYPEDVTYDQDNNCFYYPVTQSETLALNPGVILMDVRVKFRSSDVVGGGKIPITIMDATSEEVL